MKKWGGQLDIRPPNPKIGGDVPPPIPPGLTPLPICASVRISSNLSKRHDYLQWNPCVCLRKG